MEELTFWNLYRGFCFVAGNFVLLVWARDFVYSFGKPPQTIMKLQLSGRQKREFSRITEELTDWIDRLEDSAGTVMIMTTKTESVLFDGSYAEMRR